MEEDEVGYCKPPRSGRIKKGERRNPNGRRGKNPKSSIRATDAQIIKMLDEETIEFQGRKITKREAMYRVLFAKALAGDVKALRHLEIAREKSGLAKGGGVLVVPGMRPLEEWSAAAAIQQEKYREKRDPKDQK